MNVCVWVSKFALSTSTDREKGYNFLFNLSQEFAFSYNNIQVQQVTACFTKIASTSLVQSTPYTSGLQERLTREYSLNLRQEWNLNNQAEPLPEYIERPIRF